MDEPLLSVRDLKTHFIADEGTTYAVDGVSFDVYPGRTLCIVGETGCGKSVTARSILRLIERPGQIVSGQILLRKDDGWTDLVKLPSGGAEIRAVRGGEIGLVFQEPMTSLSPVHTVGNQVMEAIRQHAELPDKEIRPRAAELLDMVGVPDPDQRLDAYPWQLSGGLLQRCMIAMALAGGPRLLIADEPTTALDVITQAQILDLIRDLQERTGLTIILITHDLGVVAQMADDVAVMYLGSVVEKGPVEDVFAEPKHPYTQALLRSIPSLHAVTRVQLPTISGSIPHPFNRPKGCAFHPRCTKAVSGLCDEQTAPLKTLTEDHQVSCHLYDLPDPELRPAASLLVTEIAGQEQAAMDPAPVSRDARRDGQDTGKLLEVKNLCKVFSRQGRRLGRGRGGFRAVDNVSFDLETGETLALVGESGSGKTTTSRCILRAIAPESGDILFHTKSGAVVDLARMPRKRLYPLRPELQMIFQDPYSSLNPRMTILDIIGEPLLVNGVKSRQERIDRVEELLGLVGLRKEYMRRFPHAFSGGQRQRIGIARALALNPRLIVADEPVSALDVSVQAQTLNLLMELQDRLGLTYLFVSHDLSVVRHISDRIGVMFGGQLVELGAAEEVLGAPRHPYTAALLAAIPKADPRERARFNIPRAKSVQGSEPPAGCRFQRRCQFATEICALKEPEWAEITPGRRVRCHHAGEIALPAA